MPSSHAFAAKETSLEVLRIIVQKGITANNNYLQDDSVWGSAATHQGWKGFGPSQWEVATTRTGHKGHK